MSGTTASQLPAMEEDGGKVLGRGMGCVQEDRRFSVSKRPDSAHYLKTLMPFSPCSCNVKINASLYLPFPFGLVSLVPYHLF